MEKSEITELAERVVVLVKDTHPLAATTALKVAELLIQLRASESIAYSISSE
jgi:hypothetical protein